MSISALVKATESLKKREGDLLPTLKTIFFEGLKHKYKRKTIREVLIESKGGSWGNDYFTGRIKAKVLRRPDIRFGFIDYENAEERYFTEKEIENFNLKDNDILVIKSNGSLDLVGKSQLYKVNKKFPFVIASNFLLVLSPNEKIIYPEYLDLFLKSPESLVWRFDTQKTTTGLRNLSSQAYLNIDIPVPISIIEQKELYNSFSQFIKGKIDADELEIIKFYFLSKSKEELFSELTTQQDLLTQLRQAFLREAMQGKLVKQDKKDGNATDLLQKIKAEKAKLIAEKKLKKEKELPPIKEEEIPFEIPENWLWCHLGEFCQLINGDRSKNYPNRNEYVSEGFPWINTGHIEPDGTLSKTDMHFITKAKFDSLRSGKIKDGDLVYCLRGATFGKTAFVTPYHEGAVASSLMIIRLSELMDKRFVYYYLKSDFAKIQLLRFNNGSAQPNLAANDVNLYYFPLPPLAEQKRIVKKLEEVMNLCEELKTTITDNQNYTNQLLQVALKDALQMKEVEVEN